jgi:hypothetical protein
MNRELIFSFVNPNTKEPLRKQYKFFKTAIDAAMGKNEKKFVFFGGGVNCGKTYTALFTLLYLCSKFPNSKWYIIRKTLPALLSTTVESAKKLFPPNAGRWIQSKDNFRFQFTNGSVIHFFSENYDSDKELFRFRGLEFNGALLEEINELQPATYIKVIERCGRWKVAGYKMPNPIILATFNPCSNEFWRNLLYYPYKTGNIPKETEIIMATYKDNPFITETELGMYHNISSLDERHYEMFINGNWDAFTNIKAWLYTFQKSRHVRRVSYNPKAPVTISFDFNVNPMVCLLAHYYPESSELHIFKEIRLPNSDIYAICNEIKKSISPKSGVIITGDSTGKNRNVAIRNNASYYSIILQELGLPQNALNVPGKNIALNDSRLIVNAALEKFSISIDESCKNLIEDLLVTECGQEGKIIKTNTEKTHLFDAFRYLVHRYYTAAVLRV